MRIVLRLPEVKEEAEGHPTRCPWCGGSTFQKWGQERRRIKDPQVKVVTIRRYKCTQCQRTFRHYPEGVSRAQQSRRLRQVSVVMWSLGLSYRSIALVLSVFGLVLSHMSGWRDVQEAGKRLRQRLGKKKVKVIGVDGAWQQGQGMVVAVDMGTGHVLEVAQIDEKDKEALEPWLQLLQEEYGVEVIVTDDLGTYKGLADKLGLKHQVCQFHVRRWAGRALQQLEKALPAEWHTVLQRIRALLSALPKDGGQELLRIWEALPGRTTRPDQPRTPMEKLRNLVLRLSNDWKRYIAFYDDPDIPWTNNRTEQIIGRMKSRGRRVRGYKSPSGRLHGNLVAAQFWI
jgi:transposase-like protein